MALVKATKNGNWSDTSVWSTAALPGNGDTVYPNGFVVTVDQDVTIGGANNVDVNCGSLIVGCRYVIKATGSVSFVGFGAAANVVGTVFIATAAGSGTGVATTRATLTNLVNASASVVTGGLFLISSSRAITADVLAGSSPASSSGQWATLMVGRLLPDSLALVSAGSFEVGVAYQITTVGDTDWVAIGAASATLGIIFTATGVGSGTGVAMTLAFPLTVNFTLTGNVYGASVSTPCSAIICNAIYGTLTIVGNIYGGANSSYVITVGAGTFMNMVVVGSITGGTGSTVYCIVNYANSSTTFSVTGNITGGTSTSCISVYLLGGAEVTVIGNITGGTGSSAVGLYSNGDGNITVTGNITGGSAGIGLQVVSNLIETLRVYGTVSGGGTAGISLGASSPTDCIVTGDIYGGAGNNGLYSPSINARVTLYGSAYDATYCAVRAARMNFGSLVAGAKYRVALSGSGTYVTFHSADSGLTSAQASPSDVRAGTVYAGGSLTGTMQIPAAAYVDLGVAVDGGVGTAVISLGSLRKLLTS